MKKIYAFISCGLLLSCSESVETKTNKEEPMAQMTPPIAEIKPETLSIHDHERVDNYYWLRERENPEVIAYLEAENKYTTENLKHTEPLQEQIYDEIVGRIKKDDSSVPYKKNGYYYYSRYEEGKEYPIYVRKKEHLENKEEIILNVNELAEGLDYCQVGGLSVSPDNKLLAFGIDTVSRRLYTIKFKNLETGEMLSDEIPGTTGGVAWANDNKTVFYTLKDPQTLRSHKIFRHELGTLTAKDVEVYHEEDETFGCFAYKTKSEEYIMIGSYSTLSTEYSFVEADNPAGELEIIQPRQKDLEYSVSHHNNDFYILTNDKAKNFRLMKTPVNDPGIKNWKEVIPHRENVLLEDIEIFDKYLVLGERENGLVNIRVLDQETGNEHYIDFEEETYTVYPSINLDFDTEWLRFEYTSLTTPYSTYEYNMSTKERKLLKQTEVIGGYQPKDYHAERLYVTARDGKKVPISLVYRKDKKEEDGNPLLLYAYGSYGATMDPYFSVSRLSLMDRGFVYAIAHIRGGEDLGREWYEDGKLLKKKNTFTDFIDCAEDLLEKGYTTKEELYAMGGSAGGLLMGAIVNMRPDLWNGIVAAVPFVDVVTTMLDETIPLTTGEYDEWGNPNDKEYYDYILSYSPYDNVTAQDYPSMLVTTGLHDSQVQYWEPAKWVAKLRALKTDKNKLLLYTNMEAGHGGASGRFRRFKETAMEFAFLIDLQEKIDLE